MGSRHKEREKKRPQIVNASPYDIPDVVMGLVSKICLAKDTREYRVNLGRPLSEFVKGKYDSERKLVKEGFYQYFYRKRKLFAEHDFFWKLDIFLNNLYKEIINNENNSQVRVVVAGQFSSGKSYFVNTVFLGEEDFLPVSGEKSTAISTAIHFSEDADGIRVKATNHKGVVVNLDERILKILRHQSDGKMSFSGQVIMSVIKDLFIVKQSERFRGFTIIDTPGFNSGDDANSFNNKNDDQEALDSLKGGNIMIWIHDVTLGNLDSREIDIISKFNGPYAILLSKGNLSTPDDCETTMKKSYEQLKNKLKKDQFEKLIDVFVYDYVNDWGILPEEEQCISYSMNKLDGKKIEDVLSIIAPQTILSNNSYPSLINIHNLFQNEISIARKRQREIKKTNERYLLDWGFYAHNMFKDEMKNDVDTFISFFDSIPNKSDVYKTTDSTQKEQIKQGIILKLIKDAVGQIKAKYDFLVKEQKELDEFIETLTNFEHNLKEIVDIGAAKYKESIVEQNAYLETNYAEDIYKAIDKGDDLHFRKCLSGVDLKSTNENGYTPLTYAVRSGNNTMVKILLKYGANPCALDARGKNAFHTAVEFQYRDMCKILLETQYSYQLIDMMTEDNKDIWKLLETHSFKDWLEQELTKIRNDYR